MRHFYVICVIIDEAVDDAFFISSDFARRSDWSDSVWPIGFYQKFSYRLPRWCLGDCCDSVATIVYALSALFSLTLFFIDEESGRFEKAFTEIGPAWEVPRVPQ
jgi:hypothetical protein